MNLLYICVCMFSTGAHMFFIVRRGKPGTQYDTIYMPVSNIITQDVSYNSRIVGTSLGKAAVNCARVISPTIWPNASTEETRTYYKK